MQLRPYQRYAVEEVRFVGRGRAPTLLMVCPTGGGKTVIGSRVVAERTAQGQRVLWLAHREELIDQAAAALAREGLAVGVLRGERKEALDAPVLVSSWQALKNRMELARERQFLVVDEAHHARDDNSYGQVIAAMSGVHVLGLTATPWRTDGKGLTDVFAEHFVVREPHQLRDEGFLAGLEGFRYRTFDANDIRIRGGDFVPGQLEDAVTSDVELAGDIVAQWQAHAGGARTIAYCVGVSHAVELAARFREAGVAAEHIYENSADRAGILSRLRSGETRVVTNFAILTEGFDCPPVSCVVMARPTLSVTLHLQMLGRALRPWCYDCGREAPTNLPRCAFCGGGNHKRKGRVHDHAGNLARLGHPYAARDWSPADTKPPTVGAFYGFKEIPPQQPKEGARQAVEVDATRYEVRDVRSEDVERKKAKRRGGGTASRCPDCGVTRLGVEGVELPPHTRWAMKRAGDGWQHVEVPCTVKGDYLD